MQIRTPANLARIVKTRRQARGLTQQDVADAVGITRQSLARVERGHGGVSFDTVLRILEELGVGLSVAENAPSPSNEDSIHEATLTTATQASRGADLSSLAAAYRETDTSPLAAAAARATRNLGTSAFTTAAAEAARRVDSSRLSSAAAAAAAAQNARTSALSDVVQRNLDTSAIAAATAAATQKIDSSRLAAAAAAARNVDTSALTAAVQRNFDSSALAAAAAAATRGFIPSAALSRWRTAVDDLTKRVQENAAHTGVELDAREARRALLKATIEAGDPDRKDPLDIEGSVSESGPRGGGDG